ncbi:SLAM family member 5 [Garra rufa]|uniref:SLAM family member 5 n=1 Tax=Garra rufa TaxID=137080 RepID=UPI003CCE8E0E
MSLCRIVLLSFVCIHHVSGSDIYITGYRGHPVILQSGADRSWNLTRVQWSIYKNTTYIASFKDGKVTIFNFWRHEGRFELDNETGDLTIRDVRMDDSMTYNVALVTSNDTRKQFKVHLSVQERLQIDIQKTLHSLKDSQCHIALVCNASVQNVNLSWMPDGKFNGSYISGIQKNDNSALVLFASFSGNRNATFNCTSSSGQQTETKQMTVGCSDEKQTCEACTICSLCSSCSSCASSVMWTIVLTAVVVLVLAYAFTKNRDRIIAACPERPRKVIQRVCKVTPQTSPM